MKSNEIIDLDLPSLQSIRLGFEALVGRADDDSSSLTLRSNNELIGNDLLCRSSKSNINNFIRLEFLLSSCSDIGKYF